jgi:hypothetical protein
MNSRNGSEMQAYSAHSLTAQSRSSGTATNTAALQGLISQPLTPWEDCSFINILCKQQHPRAAEFTK